MNVPVGAEMCIPSLAASPYRVDFGKKSLRQDPMRGPQRGPSLSIPYLPPFVRDVKVRKWGLDLILVTFLVFFAI